MSDIYYALAMDVIESRCYRTEQRARLQHMLSALIDVLNASGRVVTMDFALGDEVEGLFSTREDVLSALKMMKLSMWRVAVRFGIGAGEWSVRMDGGVNRQDGQVFWNMRDAVDIAKEQSRLVHSIGEEMNEAGLETFIQYVDSLTYEEDSQLLSEYLRRDYSHCRETSDSSVRELLKCREEYNRSMIGESL